MTILRFVLITGLVFAPAGYARDKDSGADVSAAHGKEVFGQHCATCHGEAGAGAEPWYPALQRLAALQEPTSIVTTLITGRFGRAGEIDGHTVPIMPSWGQLSDADVAAVVNYIETTWGDGAEITAQEVAEIREQLWTLD